MDDKLSHFCLIRYELAIDDKASGLDHTSLLTRPQGWITFHNSQARARTLLNPPFTSIIYWLRGMYNRPLKPGNLSRPQQILAPKILTDFLPLPTPPALPLPALPPSVALFSTICGDLSVPFKRFGEYLNLSRDRNARNVSWKIAALLQDPVHRGVEIGTWDLTRWQ
jgi:hypothetical protein